MSISPLAPWDMTLTRRRGGEDYSFSERWQGVEAEGLLRRCVWRTGDDWFFAIRLLIDSDFSIAAEEAVFTSNEHGSPNPMVLRVVSGRTGRPEIHSGTARDTCYPFPSQAGVSFATQLAECRFEDAKYGAAYIVGELGEPSCAPSVWQALINTLKIEQGRPPEPEDQRGRDSWSCTIRYLQDYQNTLVYTLGRIKAFGSLWGLDVSESN